MDTSERYCKKKKKLLVKQRTFLHQQQNVRVVSDYIVPCLMKPDGVTVSHHILYWPWRWPPLPLGWAFTHTHFSSVSAVTCVFKRNSISPQTYNCKHTNRPLCNILITSSASLHQSITCKFHPLNAAVSGVQGMKNQGWVPRVERPSLCLSLWVSPSPLRPLTCLFSPLLSSNSLWPTLHACAETTASPCPGIFGAEADQL